jgi:hypothetical protein
MGRGVEARARPDEVVNQGDLQVRLNGRLVGLIWQVVVTVVVVVEGGVDNRSDETRMKLNESRQQRSTEVH